MRIIDQRKVCSVVFSGDIDEGVFMPDKDAVVDIEKESLRVIGVLLSQTRKQKRLRLPFIARALGITKEEVLAIERGERDISILELNAYANACGQKLTLSLLNAP